MTDLDTLAQLLVLGVASAVVLILVALLDTHVLHDYIERQPLLNLFCTVWLLATVLLICFVLVSSIYNGITRILGWT
jgi:hypothetical protein